MTTLADVAWTADAWAARLASGNPVFPYEWAVHYHSGAIFHRVCQGMVRTSQSAPLFGIRALRITGPSGVVEIAAPPGPVLALVLRATVVGQLGADPRCGIAAWRFGFQNAAGFWGIVLDPAGRVRREAPPGANGEHS